MNTRNPFWDKDTIKLYMEFEKLSKLILNRDEFNTFRLLKTDLQLEMIAKIINIKENINLHNIVLKQKIYLLIE